MRTYNVGVVGATGTVGQRFLSLCESHPWFKVVAVSASPKSAGKKYSEAVGGRWHLSTPIPEAVRDLIVLDAADIDAVRGKVDFVFCAVEMDKSLTLELEESYAKAEIPVVSCNSANRLTPDVPVLIPEINPEHSEVIEAQRKRLGSTRGFITTKSNCSIQSYVPALFPLLSYGIDKVIVSTYQAISGAGKTFEMWPEMVDNVIPFIGGEEEKSELEPLKVMGKVEGGKIVYRDDIVFSANCIRVPVTDGHLAAINVKFRNKPTKQQILSAWDSYVGEAQRLKLPSAPEKFLTYFEDDSRPQTKLDRDLYGGMGITIGRLRDDTVFDYRFVALSHNTLRGAAGGAVLSAELLCAQGYI